MIDFPFVFHVKSQMAILQEYNKLLISIIVMTRLGSTYEPQQVEEYRNNNGITQESNNSAVSSLPTILPVIIVTFPIIMTMLMPFSFYLFN